MAHLAEIDKLTGSNRTGTLLINKMKKNRAFWGARCKRGISKLKFQHQNLGRGDSINEKKMSQLSFVISRWIRSKKFCIFSQQQNKRKEEDGRIHEREPRSVEMAEVDYAPLFNPARARSEGIFAAVHGRRATARVLPRRLR
jgi:hypothetical protein